MQGLAKLVYFCLVARIEGFADSEAGAACEDMLSAYDDGDCEKLQEVTGRQIFSFISTEVGRNASKECCAPDLAFQNCYWVGLGHFGGVVK